MVAVTAAGTLALGSIAGATAVPSKRVHDKPVLQVVNIKGHSPLNVFDATEDDGTTMSVRPIRLRATVRYSGEKPADTLTVELDAYKKKVGGKELDNFEPISVELQLREGTKSKINTYYRATHEFTVTEAQAMQDLIVAPSTKAYLCISAADITGYDYDDDFTWSTQTRMRLRTNNGKAVRECVKIINVDPEDTDTTKDDVTELPTP